MGFSADFKKIWSDPGCGIDDILLLKSNKNDVIFTTSDNHGLPLNLQTGEIVARPDAIGKTYRIRLKGPDIISVTEITNTSSR